MSLKNQREVLVEYMNPEVREKAPFGKAMAGDAGFDLYNANGGNITVLPHRSTQVPAGIKIKLPDDCCALVYPRSSTFHKRGLFVVPGLIDSGYVGPIYTFVWNPLLDDIDRPVFIEPWERISQLIIIPLPTLKVKYVDSLPETERGTKGFGSSGK